MTDSESIDGTTASSGNETHSSNSESSGDDWEKTGSSSEDDFPYPSTANPSEIKDFYALFAFPPGRKSKDISEMSFGKWMIFRSFANIDETWHKVRIEVESGALIDSVLGASSSTLHYNPTMGGPGPCTSGVICVHTTEANTDKVGHARISEERVLLDR